MTNSVDPVQTAPRGAVCPGSTLFASILYSSVMLGNYLQQTTSADTFSDTFFLDALRVKMLVFRAEIHKVLVGKAYREDPDQTAFSKAV